MELATPLYWDCAVAAAFGKWPSELYALPEEERQLLHWWVVLRNEKEAFAYLDKEARFHWPHPVPKAQQIG